VFDPEEEASRKTTSKKSKSPSGSNGKVTEARLVELLSTFSSGSLDEEGTTARLPEGTELEAYTKSEINAVKKHLKGRGYSYDFRSRLWARS